jgi:hypothetical protein
VIKYFFHLPQGDDEDNPIQRLAQTKLYKGSDVNTFSTLIFATQFASQIWLE